MPSRTGPDLGREARLSPALKKLIAHRAKLIFRRHGTPFDALLVLGTLALAWLAGRRAPSWTADERSALALGLLLGVLVLGAPTAHRLLYRARELPLLLAQPLSARDLVAARLVELAAGSVLGCALVAAFLGGAGSAHPLGTPLGVLAVAPFLAGSQVLAAWASRKAVGTSPARGRALALAAIALLGGAVLAAVAIPGTLGAFSPWLSSRALPGAELVRVLESCDPVSLLGILAWSLASVLLALALVPRTHQEDLDGAQARPSGKRGLAFSLAGALAFALPRASRALVQRDLALIARGAFPRGVLVLLVLPAGLLVFREAALDRKLEAWEGELAALMTCGVFASLASYLFAFDFPRERASRLALERAQPVSGTAVFRARWFEGALPGVVLGLGTGLVASRGTREISELAPEIALSCALLAIGCSHHAAALGLREEASGVVDLAMAAGFPFAAAVLVVLGAIVLTISPLGALAYPVLYFGIGGRAARTWEASELASGARPSA